MSTRAVMLARSDEKALASLARGDREAAISILMQQHGDALYRYCRLMLRDASLAEDVHQTVFLQAYEGLGSYSRRSSMRAWLYGIARHRCLDALKNQRRRRKRYLFASEIDKPDDAGPEAIEVPAKAEDHLDRQDQLQALEHCLQKLSPEVRIAVLLRYVENFSYREMQRICRERPATLQARVARALPVLKRCIERRMTKR